MTKGKSEPRHDEKSELSTMPEQQRPVTRLGDLAHARSGDKGNRANIGVVANDAACYDWLRQSPDRGRGGGLPASARDRHGPAVRAARIRAFNFVIEKALAGGASRSLRLDTQGKALAVALLEMTSAGT